MNYGQSVSGGGLSSEIEQELTSHVLGYEAASIVAARTPMIGVAPPAAAALE
jgi:hypothetical protein